MKIYSKHTNGCSPSQVNYSDDTIEIIFGFIWTPFKKFKIFADIDKGDGDTYLDFSVIDLYEERIKKASCHSFEIKKVEDGGILLVFGREKVFIAGYADSIYYTSNITLVIEYEEYDRDGKVVDSEVKKIDLSNHINYPKT